MADSLSTPPGSEASPAAPRRRERLEVEHQDRKPSWLKVKAPGGENYAQLKQTLRKLDLYTVCEEARCPNMGECWSSGTATVMLLGHTCTRGCRFCAVTTGNPRGFVDPREPEHVAKAIAQVGLKYVVLTMVDRDDLLDGGAAHMAKAVSNLHRLQPDLLVETLVGDFGGRKRDIATMVESAPDVFAHNIEVPRRLTPFIRDARCDYDLSLGVLRRAKELAPDRFVKSSIMVGMGEADEEVVETMRDLRDAGVDVVTLGQYLRPTPKHAAVARFVTPETFAEYERVGYELGFQFVASGALVRSSYHAAEGFIAARVRGGRDPSPKREEGSATVANDEPQLIPASSLIRRAPAPGV
ncbi:MAG TPA: lipoyl synthase [Polyangiaceae bacterium]|nr:lipoyl synthase [Polyangiaceae bacterium]